MATSFHRHDLGSAKPFVIVLALGATIISWSTLHIDAHQSAISSVRAAASPDASAVLWREPRNITSRNLFYGPGGKRHQPHGPFTFVKEDLAGSNPKFVVRDERGVKWKIKLGEEARPETVASRLVWAVGYTADEDYFLPSAQIKEMPLHVHRGQRLIGPDRVMRNVRFKREPSKRTKVGIWKWKSDPFRGTREWNGLRVLMAVINNWDLKDDNNAIRAVTPHQPPFVDAQRYEVSDLGASFGSGTLDRSRAESKGNLQAYANSPFISRVNADSVDFTVPRRPALVILLNPHEFFSRLQLRWIGHQIPREDARWMGQLLARLSPRQLRDAFRAAGYSPEDIEGFTTVLERRIMLLNQL
jgi:hypothetical protein